MMLNRRFDAELAAKNYAHSLQTDTKTMQTWDKELWRGTRLLVPIRLQALVVTQENKAGPWAAVRLDPHAIPGYSEAAGETQPEGESASELPAPFETYSQRDLGVHLHWALPDGLTRGKQTPTSEPPPPQAAESELGVQNPPAPPQETTFPPIPDRWLVIRMYSSGQDSRRRYKAWVLESEERDPQAQVTPLHLWKEDRSKIDKRWMTALGFGDPAFAAYYDNVKGILGFHDPLQDGVRGQLTYLVIGWYSRHEDDPLYKPKNKDAWLALLKDLGWTLSDSQESPEVTMQNYIQEIKKKADQAGLEFNYQPYDVGYVMMPESIVDGAAKTMLSSAEVSPQPTEVTQPTEFTQPTIAQANISEGMAAVRDASMIALAVEKNEFTHYWPRQILCHGMVVGVNWRGPQANLLGLDEKPNQMELALGNTSIEALSALIAKESNRSEIEKVLSAFHYGMLSDLSSADGLATLESLLHSEDFLSRPGGYIVDEIEEGDLFPRNTASEISANWLRPWEAMQGNQAYLADLRTTIEDQAAGISAIPNQPSAKSSAKYNVIPEQANPTYYQGIGRPSVNLTFQKEKFVVKRDAPFANLLEQMGPERMVDISDQVKTTFEKTSRRKVAYRRPMPRFFEPRDPVVLLSGAGRAFKHGEDGFFTEEGKLVCRLTGETVNEVAIVVGKTATEVEQTVRLPVKTVHICQDNLLSGQIPPECIYLYDEALYLDYTNAPIIAQALLQDQSYIDKVAPPGLVNRHGMSEENLARKTLVEQSLVWLPALNQDVDCQALIALSGLTGKMPSPVSYHIWRQPWTPLHLAWEVAWAPSTNDQGALLPGDWQLSEHDFTWDGGVIGAGRTQQVYSGRTLLTPAIANVVRDRIVKFLEDEQKGKTDFATDSQEQALDAALEELKKTDMLAASLGELHETLIGLVERYHFTPDTEAGSEPHIDMTTDRDPNLPVFAVRAGHLKLLRLRIIDAFGRYYDLPQQKLNAPVLPEDMRADQPEWIAMPPRIVQPSRLMFRMLVANDDKKEATKNHSPICGWLMPDHLDEAMEVYDASGVNQGQVQVRPDSAGLEWQGVPGLSNEPLGQAPKLTNHHLQGFVRGLLAWGVKDSAVLAAGQTLKESALSAFLRMTDATLWTVDPLGREGSEHLSVLVGRPLAVVRASLRLDLETPPVSEELARTSFQVRLGALTRLYDGLIGYFLHDDYSQFYPVHEVIAEQTRSIHPNQGFLGAIQTVQGYYQKFGQGQSADPVVHPYINKDPTVKIRPGQKVMLTLLVDPRGGVHATSGILPRKRIELMREHVATALDNISVTFRIGPLLTDPQTIRMPLPAEIKGGWSWIHRTSATVWTEVPVINETSEAHLGNTPAEIQEGWLKLSGALKKDK